MRCKVIFKEAKKEAKEPSPCFPVPLLPGVGETKMSNKKKKKLTKVQQEYQDFSKAREPQRPVLLNVVRAFFVGGFICLLGQLVQDFFIWNFDFTEKTAGNPAVAVMIILSVILTSLGVYDHIAQWAGAGTAVPVTGFANSVASAAIEHRSEGFVLGVGGNMFKLAGSVIVFGVFAAFIVALIKTTLAILGGS
ncbi:SpoVA protein [Pelotomaculum schinkii]|uniref:SpoVA protein n=2 Tax=Desulfotomaculaceae TaxID=2937910 RepID=A0A4Y7RFR0_9FIRM|nr:SpoVA protein [Pelotomaculum schinkii]